MRGGGGCNGRLGAGAIISDRRWGRTATDVWAQMVKSGGMRHGLYYWLNR
jgi:hypothetical protein